VWCSKPPSTQETGAGESGVQGHPGLNSKTLSENKTKEYEIILKLILWKLRVEGWLLRLGREWKRKEEKRLVHGSKLYLDRSEKFHSHRRVTVHNENVLYISKH
jgi:hypothetical protein